MSIGAMLERYPSSPTRSVPSHAGATPARQPPRPLRAARRSLWRPCAARSLEAVLLRQRVRVETETRASSKRPSIASRWARDRRNAAPSRRFASVRGHLREQRERFTDWHRPASRQSARTGGSRPPERDRRRHARAAPRAPGRSDRRGSLSSPEPHLASVGERARQPGLVTQFLEDANRRVDLAQRIHP